MPFTLVYENTGDVALNNLTIFDNVLAQFGPTVIGTSNLTVSNFSGTGTAPTANPAWEVDNSQSLVFGGFVNPGDSFEVNFVVTIDPDISGLSDHLVNQAVANGEAVDANGNALLDSAGQALTATDDSDNGSDATAENGEASPDGVFANDPTPVLIADLGIAKSVVGQPTLVGDNYQVVFEAVIENTGTVDLANLTLTEDVASQFGSVFVNASNLTLISSTTNPSSSVTLNSAFNGGSDTLLLDASAFNTLHVGDSFTVQFTCLLYTSPSPRDKRQSRMPSSA